MQVIKWMSIPVFVLTLIGCAEYETGDNGTQDNMNSQPIKYETQEEQDERLGTESDEQKTYPDNKYKDINEGDSGKNTDKFTNEMSLSISNHLKQRHDVRQAQVAVTDEKVVVGVMLTDQAPPDMRDLVEEEVQQLVPNKDVYVYTDDIYWDRMRNKDAELDQLNGDVREYLREFFNRDREHF
ncbi:YhcN/YlaJ family sporulation lipoprotein [Lentibacillus sp. CBA3610]|uniref:YhcN/YlaJ family sporulation lipoprotein n=1 Tax=Lentibacillus sp. CBA3610 TaxID=2518176 RepID=UPI00159611B9|nr:YhcN/YlaJ family sporulation lipoprotein [Lentibacillus sp. CBA3610]QKY69569.1 hypothetical protein Len3610_08120 [Lentibacillus sp. CBA3610]